jgi:G5 domain/Lytic transglycolase
VRRAALIALSLLAGTSLLRSSMALSVPREEADATLNLTLAKPADHGHRPGAPWAIQGAPMGSWKLAEESLDTLISGPAPDGLTLVALTVKTGRKDPRPVLTNAITAGQLVHALGVKLGESDMVKPNVRTVLRTGMRFRIIRIRQAEETRTETVPYRTLIQYSKDLDLGQTQVLSPGASGSAIRKYWVTYRNGREADRVMLSERILSEPIDQVVLTGTKISEHGSQIGQASWYDFCKEEGDYAAHLTLPFGTVVTVRNLDNDQTVTVVINDRGPYGVPGRIIDLCDSAFAKIAPLSQGVADVEITW